MCDSFSYQVMINIYYIFTSLVLVAIKLKNKILDSIRKKDSTADIIKWYLQYFITKTWEKPKRDLTDLNKIVKVKAYTKFIVNRSCFFFKQL